MKEMFKRHKKKHVSYLLTGTKTDTQRAEKKARKKHTSIYCQLAYEKGAKNIQWGKDKLFNNGTGKTGQCQEAVPLSFSIHRNQLKRD